MQNLQKWITIEHYDVATEIGGGWDNDQRYNEIQQVAKFDNTFSTMYNNIATVRIYITTLHVHMTFTL